MLEHRLKDRITVHRDYGTLPLVECYVGQLNQVIMNLVANAIDAIEGQGGIWITTRVDEHNAVRIAVRDNGHGISPEHRSHLFEPFFTTKPVGQGTGLGLSISYGIIEKHGGRIEVESEAGKGSTLTIVLPISQTMNGFPLSRE